MDVIFRGKLMWLVEDYARAMCDYNNSGGKQFYLDRMLEVKINIIQSISDMESAIKLAGEK